ncbi:hypothetical protein JCM24511_05583 [Saitozyma sp. JCM 24511]|nr:hypothetical protein JCM24511_05583 [Saitozyma sp. JCM 24511]
MLKLWLLPATCLVVVKAHIALWDPGMFGLNYPYQADDTSNLAWNNNAPVNPLREMDALTESQWFGHGFLGYPPASGNFMTLPSGGTYHGEHGCNRAETSLRNPDISDPLPYYACPAGDGSTGVGALHTMNTYNGTFDEVWQGGAALAIAYTSDISTLQPNDLTVISINQTAVWARAVDYQIPAGMPPCPTGGCLCTWNWIHEANHGEGYPFEMYNVLYRCQVTGATDATKTVQRGSVPVDCTNSSSSCITGPKTPMYIYQADGNNIAHLNTPPNYKSTWGFNDGAQNDIFVAATKPAPTTYIVNPYATPTGTTVAGGTPTATALPSGWVSYGCSTDQDSPRVLNGPSVASDNNTISGCTSSCASQGYTWAGVEYGRECWCGSSALINPTNSSNCNVPCSGDPWAKCGGSYAIEVFFGPSTVPEVPGADTLPTGWSNLGCFTDQDSPRTLDSDFVTSSNNTYSQCIAHCSSANYTYAGVEYGDECWCKNSLNMTRLTTDGGCNVPCAGDPASNCGGSYHIQVFGPSSAVVNATTTMSNATATATGTANSTATAANSTITTTAVTNATTTTHIVNATTTTNSVTANTTTTLTTNTTTTPTTIATTTTTTASKTTTTSATPSSTLPAGWADLGCMVDSNSRLLSVYIGNSIKNTAATCIQRCAAAGYTYAGTEWSTECYCAKRIKSTATTTGCNMPCTGDLKSTCGGFYRINVYGPAATTTKSAAQTCTMTLAQQILYFFGMISNPCPSTSATNKRWMRIDRRGVAV